MLHLENLKIYKSSAGSGKTFTLVLEYLKLVLQHPEDYKSILAITFTNKAAEEMKNRIISALVSLSNGEESPIRSILETELLKVDITKRAEKVLKNILHDYTSFSVSTIDSFFQRILRALAREIHLPINMQVEVELDDAILDVTDRLMKDIGIDEDLTSWLTELAIQKIDDEKGWNLENDITSVAKELFKEEYHHTKVLTRNEIHKHYTQLQIVKTSFENRMKEFGETGLQIIRKNGFEIIDFSQGSRGVAGYFEKIIQPGNPEKYKQEGFVLQARNDIEKWASQKSKRRKEILTLTEKELHPLLIKIFNFIEAGLRDYITACEVLRKIYLFGLVNDLQKKFTAYRNENNIILLSDTTRLLNDVIEGNDAPFIYEKTGNRYKHLLIDEFQDTSILQWKNLLPLIVNALGSGFKTLIVGDAKQSVYRWRGGNMNLLLSDLFSDLKQFNSMMKEEVLSTNYRSKKNIVDFNNSFFTHAPVVANEQLKMNDFSPLKLAYGTDLLQNTSQKNETGGYVKINFIKNEETEDEETSGWKKNAMAEMLSSINDTLSKGFSYKDICILVRKNKEGNEIANWLFQNGIEEIISPDSLLITASPKIEFLINIFRFLSDTNDNISRTEIIYYYQRYISKKKEESWHEFFSDHKLSGNKKKSRINKTQTLFEGLEENVFNNLLPKEFTSQLSWFRKLPVYELSEQLISIFNLNSSPDAYIQRFQDLVLEYTSKINSSLEGFLLWWSVANNVKNCSIIVPGNTNAIRIMTIHRAKGLQFPVVMIPFAEWPLLPKANEIKWMKTNGTLVEELGSVAVVTSNRLRDTHFQEEYVNEVNQTVIDNLNLLYVGFTRAEVKLFVSCVVDNEKELNSVSKLIYRTCKIINNELNGEYFEKGNNDLYVAKPDKKISEVNSQYLKNYPINKWQDKMALSTHSGDLLAMLDNKQTSKINYGILVHAVLASIQTTNDIETVVDKIVFDGLIGSEEKIQLKKEITEVLAVPEIKIYFDKHLSVKAERELILPDGNVLRPDRVIVKDNIAMVIDFKTGRREKIHEEQVSQYVDILRKMNYKKVEGKIVYLAERIVVDCNV